MAILSANDPVAFTCVFGISRAGAVWCPVNPRNEAAENRELLDLFDCSVLIFQARSRRWSRRSGTTCRSSRPWSASTARSTARLTWDAFLGDKRGEIVDGSAVDDLAMIVGTGGTTGRPKGVMLTGTNLETMTALTLMCYPFEGRPVYLALAPLTHAAGVLCFPVLALGGEVVVMRSPDVGAFLGLIEQHRVTHTFLPPTLIYMVLEHPSASTPPTGPRCSASGTAPPRCRRPGSRRRSPASAR